MKGSLVRGVAALVCVLLVGWIWHLPQRLAGAEALADRVVRYQVKLRLARTSPVDLEARVERWIQENPAQIEQERQPLVTRFRDGMSFVDADGRRYAYLGDVDSYAWVREARNYLAHGTTCDAVSHGECRDTFVNPPHGTRMLYNRSLHIGAIVAVHRVVTWFDAAFPLVTSAAWVAILGGMCSALLAFLVGCRVAGLGAGVAAALLIPLHPFVLGRSLGSDNDIWNVILPLLLAWSTAAMLEAADWRRRSLWLAVGGLTAGLHAMTWSGWFFHSVVVLIGAALFVASGLVGRGVDRRQGRTWLAASALLVLAIVAAVAMLGSFESAGITLSKQLRASLLTPGDSFAASAAESGVWPRVFHTVGELRPSTFQQLVRDSLGRVACWVCFTGFAVLLMPRRASWWAYAGAAAFGLLLTASVDIEGLGRRFFLIGTIVPALALYVWCLRTEAAAARPGCLDYIIAVWFVAGLAMSFGGARFSLLTVTPLALAAAAAIGRSVDLLRTAALRWWSRRAPVDAVLAILVVAILVPAVSQGYAAAAGYAPLLNTAWWKVLDQVRTQTAKDAIVTSWWDYGYWVKYLAERRTTADGASLRSHLPYWIGRTLVSRDPREAIGLLRMLNCGGDNTPYPEGELSAYGRVQRVLQDAVQTQGLLLEIVRQAPAAAAATLGKRGFTPEQQAQILAATHCEPPESYLIVSRDMARRDSWMRIGQWDFRKAYIFEALRHAPPEVVSADAKQRFGFSPEAVSELVEQAQRLPQFDFVSGEAPRAPSSWYPCRPGPTTGALQCPLGLHDTSSNRVIEAVNVSLLNPSATRLRVRPANTTQSHELSPAALLFADDSLLDVPVGLDRYTGTGVLVDVEHQRVLVGPPMFLSSLYVHLVYLDGRFAPGFEKVAEEVAPSEDRVSLWRVRFPRLAPEGEEVE